MEKMCILLLLFSFTTLIYGIDVIHMSHDYTAMRDRLDLKALPVRFSFAKHFQSHMVLQQAPQRANIYGFSPNIGEIIEVEMITPVKRFYYSVRVYQGPLPNLGVWNVTLDAMGPVGPVNIIATSTNGTLYLEDVLFGDVWICSGQSNMQFMVQQIFGAAEEIASAADYPNIRFMNVHRQSSETPLHDLIAVDQPWTAPNNKTVATFSAVCWLYGKAIFKTFGYPIGLVGTDYGGTPVEAWSSPEALAKCGINHTVTRDNESQSKSFSPWDRALVDGPSSNSVLWNAMVYPLLGMTIYGSLWYQGEADAVDPVKMNRYNCTFPAMIDDWRLNFHKASSGQTNALFPFGFVQLATSMPPMDPGFVDVRWHQTADLGYVPNKRLPQVFMAVALDLPDFDSKSGPVHTRHKHEVGDRLFLSGLAVAYNQTQVVFQGPFPVKAGSSPPCKTLEIDYGERANFEVRNMEGFELLCSSGNHSTKIWWLPAGIVGYSKRIISLQIVCGEGQHVLGLRYEWQTTPCALKTCAVYSVVNELPAPPFIAFAKTSSDGATTFEFQE